MVVAGTAMSVGDVVVCRLDGALLVAELWFNAAVDGALVSCISTREQVTEMAPAAAPAASVTLRAWSRWMR